MSERKTSANAAARFETFCQEYLKDLNGTQAAIRAGYNPNSANEQAARLLAKDSIKARIEELKSARVERVRVSQDDVLSELLAVMRSNIDNYTIDPATGKVKLIDGAPRDAMRAVSSVKRKVRRVIDRSDPDNPVPLEVEDVEYKLWDKTRAIEMGMKHLGLMFDRLVIEDADKVLKEALGLSDGEELPE